MDILKILSQKYNFEYVKQIGKGGYGSVHLIKNKVGNFALKLVKLNNKFKDTKKEKYDNYLESIRNEFHKSVELKNRYIIKSILAFEHDRNKEDELFKDFPDVKCFGLIMEKANSYDLNAIIHQINNKKIFNVIMNNHPIFEQMNLIIIQFFVRQIILGIEFINSSYLVHCDIKPENILLNFNFNIKITDFSLVKPFQKDKKLKLNHGTFCVEGPEYYTENKEIDGKDAKKIDIFSLGIIICFMLYKEYKIKKIDKETNKLNYNFVETKLKELIKKIENDKEHGKLNTDLADLIISMIKPNISERASLNDILKNKWINSNDKEIERIHSINDGEFSKLFLEFQKYDKENFYPKKRKKIQI